MDSGSPPSFVGLLAEPEAPPGALADPPAFASGVAAAGAAALDAARLAGCARALLEAGVPANRAACALFVPGRIIVFPTVDSRRVAFPEAPESILGHDLAYPAMLTFLPAGVLGLVVASLAAAYMSTISTHLNWGASYVVNDFWKRFVEPDADERRLVLVGRVATRRADGARIAARALAPQRAPGIPDPAPDRRGDRG